MMSISFSKWRHHLPASLNSDLVASLVVFLVAMPLCLGVAIASGAPPVLGLVTGIVGGLIVGPLAGSPLQVSGPAAGLVVLVWEIIAGYGLQSLGIIVLLAGAMQLAAGMLRLGRLFQAVPPAVIHGMLAGIGVLVLAGQFHVMLDAKPHGAGLANLAAIPDSLSKGILVSGGSAHPLAAIIGLQTLAVLVLWNRFAPAKIKVIPGALVAVVLAAVTANLLSLPIAYVDLPQGVLSSANWPTAGLHLLLEPKVYASAAALAIIASAETLLCATAVDRMHTGPRTDYDRELSAQGIGNLVCGVFGALQLTGVIVRSSANVQAGAKTRLSAILHGGWLVLAVGAVPMLLQLVPVSALAALLVFTGFKLATQVSLPKLLARGRSELAIYLITVAAIVATDLLNGVAIGFALGLFKLLWKLTHLQVRVTDDPLGHRSELSLTGAATFLNLPALNQALDAIAADRHIHLHLERLIYIDHACLDALAAWQAQHQSRGGHVSIDWGDLAALQKRAATPAALV